MSAFGNLSGLGLPPAEHDQEAERVYGNFKSSAARFVKAESENNCKRSLAALLEATHYSGEYAVHTSHSRRARYTSTMDETLDQFYDNYVKACVKG
jgi:hypothetical protein